MSNRKRFQAVPQPLRSLNKAIKAILNWLSRGLLNLGKPQRRRQATAGFVLPTVVMMMLVVMLITTAMVLRSFDRSKNANNVRVNEATLNAAAPALDRSRAKIKELFDSVQEGTPPDDRLIAEFNTNINKYTFGDEIPLKLVYDYSNGTQPDAPDGQINDITNPGAPLKRRLKQLGSFL
uniref:Uncharacterized protein n=1 Tax=Desertifilum tharense IPPAS B-1220 TaxID=1781255 RepID=A0ACD5GYN6_9CYAN